MNAVNFYISVEKIIRHERNNFYFPPLWFIHRRLRTWWKHLSDKVFCLNRALKPGGLFSCLSVVPRLNAAVSSNADGDSCFCPKCHSSWFPVVPRLLLTKPKGWTIIDYKKMEEREEVGKANEIVSYCQLPAASRQHPVASTQQPAARSQKPEASSQIPAAILPPKK